MLILCKANGQQMNMSGEMIQDGGVFLKTALWLLEKNSGTCFFISLIAFSTFQHLIILDEKNNHSIKQTHLKGASRGAKRCYGMV